MLKNLRCFIIFFLILSWAEGEYNLKLKAELKEEGSHPRFVIKNNEETSIIAIFSKENNNSIFKEWNGSQNKSQIPAIHLMRDLIFILYSLKNNQVLILNEEPFTSSLNADETIHTIC